MAFIIGSLWDQERLTTVRRSGRHLDSDLSPVESRAKIQHRLREALQVHKIQWMVINLADIRV